MPTTALIAATQILALAWTPSAYDAAFEESAESGRPLLVFVSANWCGACHRMKADVMSELERKGAFENVNCAQVDADRESKLAERLSIEKKLPCLILFTKTDDGWKRWRLSGMQDADAVTKFLGQHAAESVAQRPDDEKSR